MPRKTQLNVGFHPKHLEQIRRLAEKESISMAEFVRQVTARALDRRKP